MPRLVWATAISRACSVTFNYLANRRYVFRNRGHWDGRSLFRYAALCVLIAGASYGVMRGLLQVVAPSKATLLKAGVDLALFLVSFAIQKLVVFRRCPITP